MLIKVTDDLWINSDKIIVIQDINDELEIHIDGLSNPIILTDQERDNFKKSMEFYSKSAFFVPKHDYHS